MKIQRQLGFFKGFDFMSEKMYLGSIEDFLGSDSGILLLCLMIQNLVKQQLFVLHLTKMPHIHDILAVQSILGPLSN